MRAMVMNRSLTAVMIAATALVVSAPPASAEPALLAPGYPLATRTPDGSPGNRCTTGFVVRNNINAPVLLVSGHCDAGGNVGVYHQPTGDWLPVGSFFLNTYGPPITISTPDIGAVSLTSAAVPVSGDLLGRTPVRGAAIPEVGQQLCKHGEISGTSCGTVIQVTENKVYFTAANRLGDSGGPVYIDNRDGTITAVGIDSAIPEYSCKTNDFSGAEDCSGNTIAELVVPWMQRWGLSF